MIRIAHTADWHIDPQNFDQTLPAIRHTVDAIQAEQPDLIVIAGDLFVKRGYLDPTATHHVRGVVRDLCEIAPIVVIPGNHDEQNSFDAKDSVLGALDMTETKHRLLIFARPTLHVLGLPSGDTIQIAALPTPNKYFYLSQTDDSIDVKAAISEKLCAVVRGMIAGLDPALPSILVYHGSVVGGQGDSEMLMTTGIDIALDRGVVGDTFDAILCGHLHRPQNVGRWVYSGAPAPLSFGMETVQPSWCLHLIDFLDEAGKGTWHMTRFPIPVAHQLLTIEASETNGALKIEWKKDDVTGAKIRIQGKVPEHLWDSAVEDAIKQQILSAGADSVRCSVERTRPASIRIGEARGDQDMRSLLSKWVAVNEEFREIEADLLTLSDDIEGEIPVSKRLSHAGADYRPRRVWWKNFKQYREGEIDFRNGNLGRLVCISGPNFSGKSNAAEAEAFGLYKHLRGSSKIEDVVRNGEKACEVGVEFEAGAELWRVVRSVKRGSNGSAAGDVRLEVSNGNPGEWLPKNGGTSHETERKIEEIVGPPELYFATRYRSQFDVDRLLNMKPSELKDTLQLAVNTSLFDLREEIAKGLQRRIEKEQASRGAKLETLEAHIAQAEGLSDELVEAGREKAEAEGIIAEHEAQLATVATEIEGLRRDIQTIAAQRDELAKIEMKAKKLSAEIQAARTLIESLEATLHDAPKIRAHLSEIEAIDRELLQHQANKEHYQAMTREIEGVERKLAETRQHQARLMERIEYQIRADEKASSLIGEVPFQDKCADAGCKMLKSAIEARANLPTMKQAFEDAKRDAEMAGEPFAIQIADLVKRRDAIGYDALANARAAEKLSSLRAGRWDQKNLALSRAEGELDATRQVLAGLEKSLSGAEVEASGKAVNEAGFAGLQARLRDAFEIKTGAEHNLRSARELVVAYAQKVGELQGKLKLIEAASAESQALHAAAEAGGRSLRTVAVYLRAVSRDGLPFLILESRLRSLQDYANDFIGEAPLRLEIEPLAGDRKDSVVIRFYDDKGAHPLSEASGFQRMILGVALSGALSKIAAEMNGGRAYHVFIDEGFGAYRKENFQYGKALLQKLADEFERVIFIADVPEIELVAESTLKVVVETDGNRIEVA